MKHTDKAPAPQFNAGDVVRVAPDSYYTATDGAKHPSSADPETLYVIESGPDEYGDYALQVCSSPSIYANPHGLQLVIRQLEVT